MKLYPRIRILSLAGDVLTEATMIEPNEIDAFIGEVAHDLGALLGVNREVVRALVAYDVADSIPLPLPACFELSASHRRQYARDIAGIIRPYFAAASSDVGVAA